MALSVDPSQHTIRFLALGDSYTIGEGVRSADSWPEQFAGELNRAGYSVAESCVIAETGWTTGDLIAAIDCRDPAGPFDLVSVMIGVNNQYQGRAESEYKQEFDDILIRAQLAGGESGRVLVLSIPDWGVTPFSLGRDRNGIAGEIDRFNMINRSAAHRASVRYIDITPISRAASADVSLLTADGLHPSAKMYRRWVELIICEACAVIATRQKLGNTLPRRPSGDTAGR